MRTVALMLHLYFVRKFKAFTCSHTSNSINSENNNIYTKYNTKDNVKRICNAKQQDVNN